MVEVEEMGGGGRVEEGGCRRREEMIQEEGIGFDMLIREGWRRRKGEGGGNGRRGMYEREDTGVG